ncbi:MAG TPA: hypothetical protein VKM72_06025, partial [Thermoanaerobaculia bacterium]|nr:hypothetical protein [Thermoanaerobaculia bacterium]
IAKAGSAQLRNSNSAIAALKELFQDTIDPNSPALEAKAQELIGRLTAAAAVSPDKAQDLRSAVLQTFGTTSEIGIRVDAWFETMMDRTSERFKTHSRYITIFFAIIFGFVLHIDSLALYKRISTDDALRERLLSMADSVSNDAKKLIADDGSFATLTIRRVLQDASVAAGNSATSLASVQIPALRTKADGEAWLRSQLAQATDRDAFLKAYDEQYPDVVKENLEQMETTFSTLRNKVETATPGLFSDSPASDQPIVGQLVTVIFLSLGAPFWFNALRSLSALKPVVSQKLEAEEKKNA